MVTRHRNATVFSFAVDLGEIESIPSPVTWSVGYVRDPSIQYTTASGEEQPRRPYYTIQYSNISAGVSDIYLHLL